MPELIQHPCVWTAKDLADRNDWQIELSADERDALSALSDSSPTQSPPDSLNRLAETLRDRLEHSTGFVILRRADVATRSAESAAKLFLRFCEIIGTPVSQSAQGELIYSVRDAGYADTDPRSRGPNTRKKLTFHSDRCDVIGFLCVQQALSGGENDIVSSAAVYNTLAELRPDLLAELMQPFYYLRHTVDPANPRPWCRQPVFSFTDGHFACSLLRVLIDRAAAMPDLPDLTDRQREALDAVEDIASRPDMHYSFRQQPGDILFLNNWVTLHRRSEFTDAAEEQLQRHILRVWLSVPNSRPLDEFFRDNYGSVAAGAIRGGMRSNGLLKSE
ncbi:MAG: TauD/TfdA family dioxygenase [Planctomycetaceae bacterium]|nr:TauD/TfdA family dioxygenase [Planctomycetaceae bacterium]